MSTAELRARLDSRLDELGRERPELSAALELQRGLLKREIELLEAIRVGGLPSLSLPPRYVAAKLKRGMPALHHEPVPLPAPLLTLSVRDFCDRLNAGGTAPAAAQVIEAVDGGRFDVLALLSACFGRDQQRVRLLAHHFNLSADMLWLVAELALAPFAHLLQQRIASPTASGIGDLGSGRAPSVHGSFDAGPRLPDPGSGTPDPGSPIATALAEWDRGYCPICGSWPALIEAGMDAHVLRCSFCAVGWELLSYRCTYCGYDAEGFITAASDPEKPGRRLQLCGECGGYTKVLEVGAPTVFPMVAIEDLVSLDLDMAAIERNYMRPALPNLGRR